MNRMQEIQARLAEIKNELETATGDALTALETESRTLMDELNGIKSEIEKRQQLRQSIAAGAGDPVDVPTPAQPSAEERAANEFAKTNRMNVGADQARSHLISGGTLVTPTKVDGINDIVGSKLSSIIDMVKVVNCVGMGNHKIAYLAADSDAAAVQTEGQAAGTESPTFGFVTINPTSVAVLDYISKQAKKQTTLQYSAKVREQALLALRKKAAAIVTDALKASELNDTVDGTVASGAGKIDENTLRKLALSYGGDDSVVGGATLFLNKADLLAFGDVRGTSEKKAIYEITPDGSNPNVGTIREGGLSVRYCINNNLTAFNGTAQAAAATKTMFYGNPQMLELDLFSDYEVRVSEDFAFDKLMDAIRGDVELGSDVIAKGGFVALVVPATGA